MQKIIVIVLLSAIVGCFQACFKKENIEQDVREQYLTDIDSLRSSIAVLEENTRIGVDEQTLQQNLRAARLRYKKIEYLVEYFSPYTADFINGAPLDEIEVYDNKVISPEGFQVIEAYLFPVYDKSRKTELIAHVHSLLMTMNRLTEQAQTTPITSQHLFDAMRLEVYRIIAMGISGFDTPESQNSVLEAAASIKGMQQTLVRYKNNATWGDKAIKYLQNNADFNSFDRMVFITQFANHLSEELLQLQLNEGITPFKALRAVNTSAKNLFVPEAFDANFFTADFEAHSSAEKVALGKLLFFDPVLSGNGNRACVSCHQPEKAFSDGLEKSIAFEGKTSIERNAPTLLNAGFQKAQFYDSRVANLEDQAAAVINNKAELHGSFEKTVLKLSESNEYQQRFASAFPQKKQPISDETIKNALASYIRSLKSFNSRFDQYVRGDKSKMSKQEIEGFNIFMGKGKCGTCHFAPLFNGTVPPNYEKSESEVIGVPATIKQTSIDNDLGKYGLFAYEQYKFSFKTPTIRNVELTAPYMHNGVFKTLEEVVDFYDKGGAAGIGADLPYLTLPFDKLNLSAQEKRNLVAFMKTLTDVPSSSVVSVKLPQLANSKLNNRKALY
ncbi:cytochrome-c peroxidase [Solitalea canadensis]|uniref:Cytochrome c peroxidase n=1 Tax=Solitalea canadensis (strain ATCC 29591 / DSM 3403 / JCM 21819 / LMG 8368 / NBRC 15130 / NCIMB 12057 / USAM 9D) TaxID=929556 RepID=H8KLE1_SOLCM|nr:cytochrome c peroxidase [Solitalea canadensis]AFD08643.1 cytochrome c peroxidase [Solitalea canadensis DSM 3403]